MTAARLDLEITAGATFGPVEMTCKDSDGVVVDLTGWQVWAQGKAPCGRIVDLSPTITDEAGGVITISLTDEENKALDAMRGAWDLILEQPTGEKLGPYISGSLRISTPITATT